MKVFVYYDKGQPVQSVIADGTARRGVVIELINSLRMRGHHEYVNINMRAVVKRANEHINVGLGESEARVPHEILSLVHDANQRDDESGKAAAPPDMSQKNRQQRAGVFDTTPMGTASTATLFE